MAPSAGVTEGPTCNFGFVWWKLQLPNGTEGWAAEGGSGDAIITWSRITVGLHMYIPGADAISA